jgi:hypothetical protein
VKKSLVFVVAAVAAFTLLVGQAGAAKRASSPTPVTVAMHDPGCHWFLVGGKYLKSLSVRGPVALANFDEAALRIVGPGGLKLDAVGKKVTLLRGSYRITMVHQAPDDNTLTLLVK